MKSDIVTVTNTGEGIGLALQAASASATYRGLESKNAIRVRLLAEEMLGLVRQIAGEFEASFWVESQGNAFELHLVLCSFITGKMRKELLKTSSTGKNEAAKGFMGMADPVLYSASADFMNWSMQNYLANVQAESMRSDKAKAEWDELERSILANLADEVKVSVNGNKAEMTVYKTF